MLNFRNESEIKENREHVVCIVEAKNILKVDTKTLVVDTRQKHREAQSSAEKNIAGKVVE